MPVSAGFTSACFVAGDWPGRVEVGGGNGGMEVLGEAMVSSLLVLLSPRCLRGGGGGGGLVWLEGCFVRGNDEGSWVVLEMKEEEMDVVDVFCGEEEAMNGAAELGIEEEEEVVCRLVDGRRDGGGMGGFLENMADWGRGEDVGGET